MAERRFLGKVQLVLVPALAAATLAACREDEVKHCVDKQGKVVDDSRCKDTPLGAAPSSTSPHGFFWYYGGTRALPMGSGVSGGSYIPSASHSYVSRSSALRSGASTSSSSHPTGTVSRGAFGGTGHAVGVSS